MSIDRERLKEEIKEELREEMIAERRPAPGNDYDGERIPNHPQNVWIDDHPFGMWVDEMRNTLTKMENAVDAESLSEWTQEIEERLDTLEEGIAQRRKEEADAVVYEGVPEHELTWMERFYHMGREGVNGDIRKRDIHAKILLKGLPDWAFRANHGAIILQTKGKLRRKLERRITDEDDDKDTFEYAELYRACAALEERTDGKILYKEDHPKVGRHLRIPNPEEIAINTDIIEGPDGSEEGKRTLLAMT